MSDTHADPSTAAPGPDAGNPSPNPAPDPAPASPHRGLTYRVAGTLGEVIDAWELVYSAYRQIDLINPNRHRLHTAPQAIGPHAAVITGCIDTLTVSTLTTITDHESPAGLPLDRVYGPELQSLRHQGRKLMEVGLFADRRRELSRAAETLFQLMRYAYFFGLYRGVTDFVIGVHPRHARFYTRAFGFEPCGTPRTYPAVNDRPVVLLRGNMDERERLRASSPALQYCAANPVAENFFADRFHFDPDDIADSPLSGFLRDLEMARLRREQSA